MIGRTAVVLAAIVTLTSCSPAARHAAAPASPSPSGLDAVRIKLTPIASIEPATSFAVRSGDRALYIGDKAGRVWALDPGSAPRVVLDLTQDVTDIRGKQWFSEQGLLGLTFSPDGRYLYADYTDRNGDSRVRAYPASQMPIDHTKGRDILFVDQQGPDESHNGGALVFDGAGHLYIGLGDGGGTHGIYGQRLDTLLGKILRIDPQGTGGYRVPNDNPFVHKRGARPEIFSYGLRNPWRLSFDRVTGDLWLNDVGENRWEEVNFRPAERMGGENFGWNIYEAGVPFASVLDVKVPTKLNPAGRIVFPIFAYPHPHPGCAAGISGYVYRGKHIPGLRGAYVFGDLCDGHVQAIRADTGRVIDQRVFREIRDHRISAFGQDLNGELYVLTLTDGVYRIDPAR